MCLFGWLIDVNGDLALINSTKPILREEFGPKSVSTHLYTLAYMSIHESCLLGCHLCFNTKKLWTFDPNLHLSLMDTTLVYLLSCFVSFFACILVSMFAMSIMFIYFMPLYYALCIFSLRGLSAGFLSLPLHVRTRSKDAWS